MEDRNIFSESIWKGMFKIGLGTAQLSNTSNIMKGVKFVPLDTAKNIISYAIEAGIRFFDSGTHYGETEGILSEVMKNHEGTNIFVATKVGLDIEGIRDFSIKKLNSQLNSSLDSLSVDSIDLLQLNKPSMADMQKGGLLEYLGQLKEHGKIKYAGLVVGEIETAFEALKSDIVDSLQVMYNLLYQETEGLIREAKKKNVLVIVRSPLNSGLLSGKYKIDQKFDQNDERNNYFTGSMYMERYIRLKRIQSELDIRDEDLLSYSINYILSNPNVTIAIPGASSIEQLKRYIEIGNTHKPFSDEKMNQIRTVVNRHMQDLKQKFQN